MSDPSQPVNVNAASTDELMTLSGVGLTLAERIIANRPYATFDDLQKVSGIGPALLEQLRPKICLESEVSVAAPEALQEFPTQAEMESGPASPAPESDLPPAPEAPVVEPTPPSAEEMAAGPAAPLPTPRAVALVEPTPPPTGETAAGPQPGPVEEAARQASPQAAAAPAQPSQRIPANVTGLVVGGSLIALLLGILLSLGILALINGGLTYASPARVNSLARQVDALSTQANTLQKDQNDLLTRVNNMESLSGRVNTLESDAQSLRSDLDNSAKQVQGLQSQVIGLNEQVKTLQDSSQTFQNFLDGLRTLLKSDPYPPAVRRRHDYRFI